MSVSEKILKYMITMKSYLISKSVLVYGSMILRIPLESIGLSIHIIMLNSVRLKDVRYVSLFP